MIKMNNNWLGIFIAKVQILVPDMTEVNQLRRQNVKLYGVKRKTMGI